MNSKGSPSWPSGENHPPAEMLFLALEGELRCAENARVEAHLKLCWECQAQVESWQEATRTLVQYRRQVEAELIPGPPSGWNSFRPALHRAALEREEAQWPRRRTIAEVFADLTRPARAAVASALTALAALVLIVYLSPVPSVSATELLQRAVAEEGPAAQTVRIRAGSGEMGHDYMRALFTAAQLDWERPLSAHAFQKWRAGLTHKTDRVTGQNSTWTLETTTGEGPLLVATLTVRASDFHPIGGNFRFAGAGAVEITEIAPEPERATVPAPKAPEGRTSAAPSEIKEPAAPQPAMVNAEAVEIDARVALFNTGNDLGDQIQIFPSENGVIVDGILDSATAKDRLARILQTVPGVEARLTSAGEGVPTDPLAGTSPATVAPAGLRNPPLLEAAIEKWFPHREERSIFVRETLEASRGVLMHAWALRRLAERYTPESAAILDKESRAKLRELVASHAEAVRRELDRTVTNLSPWIGMQPVAGTVAYGSWQTAVQDIFAQARRVDAGVTALLSKTGGDRSTEEAVEDLRRACTLLYPNLTGLKLLEKP